MRLPTAGKAGLRQEEVIAVVLYTGPMVIGGFELDVRVLQAPWDPMGFESFYNIIAVYTIAINQSSQQLGSVGYHGL